MWTQQARMQGDNMKNEKRNERLEEAIALYKSTAA